MTIDIASDTWAEVKKVCNEIVARQTELLIRSGLPAADYDGARGEIYVARAILSLALPPLVQPAVDYSRSKDRSGI